MVSVVYLQKKNFKDVRLKWNKVGITFAYFL